MRVTLAKRQPRGVECCDDCLGRMIVAKMDDKTIDAYRLNNQLPFSSNPETGVSVGRYNVFIPGCGTQQFTLDPDCAARLRA